MNSRNADSEQLNKIVDFEKEIKTIEIQKVENNYDVGFEDYDYTYDR